LFVFLLESMIINYCRSILNDERANSSNSTIHFKELIHINDQILSTIKSSTTSASASSLMLLPLNDEIVPPKPALPSKNGLSTSRLPS